MPAIIVIDSASFGFADDYYRMCTWEPVHSGEPLRLGRIFQERRLTIERLLDIIIDHCPPEGAEVILVTHATPQGINLRLVRNKPQIAQGRVLDMISSDRSAGELAPIALLPEDAITRLREKMAEVREKRLARLEVRGCRLGQDNTTMRAVRTFFGARVVGAPTVFNAYGRMRVNISAGYDYSLYDNMDGGNAYEVRERPANPLCRGDGFASYAADTV